MNIIGICSTKNSGKSTVAKMIAELVPGTVEVQLAEPLKRFCADVFGWGDDVLNGPSELREKPDLRYPRWESGVDLGDHVVPGYATHLTPRRALQTLGSEWGRRCYEDVWIDYALRAARRVSIEGWEGPNTRSFSSGSVEDRCVMCHKPVLALESYYSRGTSAVRHTRCAAAYMVVIPDVRFVNEARKIYEVGGRVWRVDRVWTASEVLADPHADRHASEREQFSNEMSKYVSLDIVNDHDLTALRKTVEQELLKHGGKAI